MDDLKVKIYGGSDLASKVALFNKKVTDHKDKQLINPFSGWEGSSHRQKLSKTDEKYGRPVEGSKTEFRGKKAGDLINNEIRTLIDMIWEFGVRNEDETAYIPFGELFEIYNHISNKLVGLLMRARKHGLIYFEGEMLFQRRDDHVIITLLHPVSELRKGTSSQKE